MMSIHCKFRRITCNFHWPVTHLLIQGSQTSTSEAIKPSNDYNNDPHTHLSVNAKSYNEIPGPKPLPVIRNLHQFKKNYFSLHKYLEHCSEKYGKIFKMEAPGGNRFVYISNPNALESVLRVEGKYPMRETSISPSLQWMMNKFDFAVPLPFKSGEDWKKSRSASNNQIKPSNVQTYTAGLSDTIDNFVDFVESTKDTEGRLYDVNMPLKRLFVSTTAKIVFNADVHTLYNPAKETEEFIRAINLIFDSLQRLLIEPPLFKVYPNKVYRDLKKGFTVINQYGVKYAEEALRVIQCKEKAHVHGLLGQWLLEGKMSQKEAMMASASMFAAGVDSTSSQASLMLHCIARNPDVQERLYDEIKSVLGQRTQPTPEDLKKMPYLKGCMMESFRMYPSGIIVARVLENDINLMGYNIPAETNIIYLNSVPGKNKNLFSNPEMFDPERWIRDKPNPFSLLLFGFGPRSCYGKRFAELELKLLLCKLIQNYSLETDSEHLDVCFASNIRPVGNFPMYFKNRDVK